VTFPAASTIFTDSGEYGLSSSQYGALFLPQVITVVAAALVGVGLGVSLPTIYAWAAAVAGLLAVSSFVVARHRPSPVSLHPYLGHAH
jgi:hypothetical protein